MCHGWSFALLKSLGGSSGCHGANLKYKAKNSNMSAHAQAKNVSMTIL
jgi:hypothetical protein